MIIPSKISRQSPPGEKVIFNMFLEDANCYDWTILHSLNLPDHIKNTSGEIDFLLLIPNKGLFVLEVKSHKKLEYNGMHGWRLGNNCSTNPFKQVSDAKYSLIRTLKINNLNHNLPVVSCVWFTHLNFNISSSEWRDCDYLDKSDRKYKISTKILSVFDEQVNHLSNKLNFDYEKILETKGKIEQLRNVLRPDFTVIADTSYSKSTSELSLKIATENQLEILNSINSNQRILINGLAGTGKTSLALEAVRRELIDNEKSKVAFFCFNKFFGNHISRISSQFSSDLTCGRYMQWLYSICCKLNLVTGSDIDKPNFWDSVMQTRIHDEFKKHLGNKGWIDLLVIDESQDLLDENNLKIFDLMLKGGLKNGRWLIVGDFDYQNIFNRRLDLCSYFNSNTINYVDFKIRKNCRNTPEVGNFLKKASKYKPLYSSYIRSPNGIHPEIISYDNIDELRDNISQRIDELLSKGYEKKDIIVLSPQKEVSIFSDSKEMAIRNHRICYFDFNINEIRYSTIHAFKGLESEVVIIIGVEDLSPKSRNLLYVAISRATSQVYLYLNQLLINEI